MRSADATPPSRQPRSKRTRSTLSVRAAVVLLLIALVIPALPLSNLTNAQSDAPDQPVSPTEAATDGNVGPDPSSDSAGQVADATLIPATGVTNEPSPSEPDTSPTSPAEIPLGEPTGIPSITEPAAPSTPPFTAAPADLSVSSDEVIVSAADVGLPVVCQLVLGVTAIPPAPGKTVNDPLPDPVAGATFTVSNAGGDSITMISTGEGTVNVHGAALSTNGLAVSTGDQLTVTQTGTRAGLSLGEPVFASTFIWQSAFSSTCRVESFVINPVATQPPSPSAIASDRPSLASSALPTTSPSPSASASVSAPPSILPSPTPSPLPSPSPTATIPVGYGQIEVWTVARPTAAGQTPVRLAGGRFSVVDRSDHTTVTTMTTGADGTALSRLLPLGTYDLILDAPPPGYLRAEARAFSVSSPTLQRIVFEMDPDPNPPTTRTPPVSPSPSAVASASPSAAATNTPRATETRTIGTTTPQSTATTRASSTPQATATPGATAQPSRPYQTPTAAPRPPRATSTAIGTATSRPATATVRPGTTTPTPGPATATATAKPVTGTPTRPPRATAPAGTTTAAPNPQTPAATATRAASTGTPTRAPRATATIQSSPTRVTQFTEARITVEVSICIDPRFTDSGEFGSTTDIDRSRCRSARSGETRITLTSTYPSYLPRYAQTTSTDSAGRVTFVFPPTREDRIGTLHLEGPINVEDAGVRIYSGRTLAIPLTIVVPDPNAPPIGSVSSAGATTTSGVGSWSFATAPGVLLTSVTAAWRLGRTRKSTRLRD